MLISPMLHLEVCMLNKCWAAVRRTSMRNLPARWMYARLQKCTLLVDEARRAQVQRAVLGAPGGLGSRARARPGCAHGEGAARVLIRWRRGARAGPC